MFPFSKDQEGKKKTRIGQRPSWFFVGICPTYVDSTMPFLHLIQTRPVVKVGILLTGLNVPSRRLALTG